MQQDGFVWLDTPRRSERAGTAPSTTSTATVAAEAPVSEQLEGPSVDDGLPEIRWQPPVNTRALLKVALRGLARTKLGRRALPLTALPLTALPLAALAQPLGALAQSMGRRLAHALRDRLAVAPFASVR